MRKRSIVTGLILALVTVLVAVERPGRSARADRENDKVMVIDVACDARTYKQNNVDPAALGSHRGDTFIVAGKIYPGGTIPSGDGVFSPDNPGSIGKWICRGVWLISSDQLAAGVTPGFDTTQIYLLPDESHQLFSEGLEGSAPTLRAVTGGTGTTRGAAGQVQQELLGTNTTGLFNIRFTFRLSREDK